MKFNMKSQLIIVVLILSLTNLAFSSDQSKNLVEVHYDWCLENDIQIDEILKNGTDDDAIPIINTLGLIWKHRDGEIWIGVAPRISSAFLYKPRLMFLWFSKHEKEYSSWLKEMPTALFTAWSGENSDVVRLEKLRVKMIENLKIYQKSESNEDLRQNCLALIEVLQKTKVDKIQ